MTATFHVGDAIQVMNTLPEKSVDLILTSPPFLALRSYLPADHPLKSLEGGSQSTPGAYIDWLVDVVEACDRVLAPHGSLCFELGDTYAGSGGENHLYEGSNPTGGFNGSADFGTLPTPKRIKTGWPLPKSLSLIPELFRLTLVYGTNPLTGRTTERWRLRNVIRWVRPNPPVGALGDKFRPATSELMVFCKSAKRFFDLDAVREPYSERFQRGIDNGEKRGPMTGAGEDVQMANFPKGMSTDHAGAPPLDWWNIPPGGYEGAHYACVDDQTEALTRDGWKTHKELLDGDEIAAYDLPTDRIVWQTAKFVRYDVEGEELVCIEKEQTSQRLTVNHRMLVKSRKRDSFVKLAGEVSSGYDLPLSAPWGESGTINGPGTVHAAIFGWFITEGSARPLSRQAYIYQSQTANPKKVAQIRQLLEWSEAPFDERIRDRADEFPGKGIQHVFVIHDSPLARWLRDHHKRLPLDYVFNWPDKDARALFEAMVDGDGSRRADGRISFVQKDRALADAFQCLATRLSYRAVIKWRASHNVHTVYVSENRWVTLRGPDGKRAPIPSETYTGVVWCPLVDSTFWLARRHGKPFITGNTWPPELCVKPIKAMSPERVCRQCGEPSRRIVGEAEYLKPDGRKHAELDMRVGTRVAPGVNQWLNPGHDTGNMTRVAPTLGFSDCGHDDWRPGLILDPFAGSGTTLAVATGHGRDAVGIDVDSRNYELALQRVGPLILQRGEVAA